MAIDHAYFSDCFFFPADAAVAAAAVLSLLLLLSLALTGGKRSPGDVFDVLLRHSTAHMQTYSTQKESCCSSRLAHIQKPTRDCSVKCKLLLLLLLLPLSPLLMASDRSSIALWL